jgi:hypothetical protein
MKEIWENLKINTVAGKLMNNKMRWYRYILRMNKDKILKKNEQENKRKTLKRGTEVMVR